MLDAASVALVEEQVAKLRELAPALSIDSVEQQGVDVYVTFRRRRDGRNYVLRFRCDGYPVQPPSVLFVDPVSRENSGLDIWPNDGEQAIKRSWPTPFICLPGIREYHQSHGPVQPTVHRLALAAILQLILQSLESRG